MEIIPTWLEPLLGTTFFHICRRHGDAARSECNMFCLDCHLDAFCYYCRSSKHRDHNVIQIRRSSYHDVVRVGDVQNMLDISGVQTYTINSARVMFLNQRPQPKSNAKGVSHLCEICGRGLLDQLRFCSLGCKLVGVKRNGNTSFGLKKDDGDGNSMARRTKTCSVANKRDEELLLFEEGSHQPIIISPPSTPPYNPPNSRRRKGIPHRAPLKS